MLRAGYTTAEICHRVGVTARSIAAVRAHIARTNRRAMSLQPATRTHAPAKAIRTAKWAHIMVKWLIRKARAERGWEIVNFTGRAGRESTGIVDLLAIRKDHSMAAVKHRGDFFEMILIQVKGGSAARPNGNDIARLRRVAERYRARAVVLGEWERGVALTLFTLNQRRKGRFDEEWVEVEDVKRLFA